MATGPIVVVAGDWDLEARALGARLPDLDIRLLRPDDLSRRGWAFRPGCAGGTAVVGGEPMPVGQIGGVLVRLPWVTEHDLPHIAAPDRAYVAAEMTAFLRAWLSALRCPVVNRPSTACLAGPLWRPERWAAVAAGIGLAGAPVRRRAGAAHPLAAVPDVVGAVVITVAGARCIGDVQDPLAGRLRLLARLAGAEVLTVWLSGRGTDARLLAASPWADLTDDRVRQAVLALAGAARPAQEVHA